MGVFTCIVCTQVIIVITLRLISFGRVALVAAGFVCLVLMMVWVLVFAWFWCAIESVGLDVVITDLPLCLIACGDFVVLEVVLFCMLRLLL